MKESNVRHHLITNIKEFGHVEAIENGAGVGNPDVNYCIEGYEGWIEIKYREKWPIRSSTPGIGKCLKPSQPIWFKKRLDAGAKRIFLYLRIENEFMLLAGERYVDFETLTRQELYDASLWFGETRDCDWQALVRMLIF
jgi:hypothetical protein